MLKFAGVALAVLGAFLAGCSGGGDRGHGSHDHGSAKEEVQSGDQHGAHLHGDAADSDASAEGAAVEMNELCPVMNEEADPEIYTVYRGRKVYFCCDECVEKFKADPEAYLAKAFPDASDR